MNYFTVFIYFQSYYIFHQTGKHPTTWIFKGFTCLVVGYIYSIIGYKKTLLPLLACNIILSFILLYITDHPSSRYVILSYLIFILVEETQLVITVSAVPQTFGIKYGSIILCIVLCGRILALVTIYYLPKNKWVLFTTGIVTQVLAFLICLNFKEMLDINQLVARKCIVFNNFGISRKSMIVKGQK
jgi:hypothetical protein